MYICKNKILVKSILYPNFCLDEKKYKKKKKQDKEKADVLKIKLGAYY